MYKGTRERKCTEHNGGEEGRGRAKKKFGIEKGEMEKIRDLEEGRAEGIMARIRDKIETEGKEKGESMTRRIQCRIQGNSNTRKTKLSEG